MKAVIAIFVLSFGLAASAPVCDAASDQLGQRGCCSYHGGVCDCDRSEGRRVCCDGTYSPTCACR